jgi:Ca-activated chloride channel homolog
MNTLVMKRHSDFYLGCFVFYLDTLDLYRHNSLNIGDESRNQFLELSDTNTDTFLEKHDEVTDRF